VLHVESSQAFVRGSFVDGAQIVTTGLNRIAPGQVVTIRQVN
jgi:hypothetical protein